MNLEVIIALGLGIIWVSAGQARKAAKRQGAVAVGPAAPMSAHISLRRIFLGWIVSIVGLNILAALTWLLIDYTVRHDLNAFVSLGGFVGWLLVWGHVVHRLAFPHPYLTFLDRQQTYSFGPACGYFIIGISMIGWMLAMIGRMWTWAFS